MGLINDNINVEDYRIIHKSEDPHSGFVNTVDHALIINLKTGAACDLHRTLSMTMPTDCSDCDY
ncbi:hypothetical protein GCM10007941_33720 [Amphritea balenae]|nr:hypothetical protein GCM10007941_33720 [Amphritea balenae]